MAKRFNTHLKRISEPGYKIRIWDFYSGNFSVRKETLLEAGSFNESFRIYGYEDVEFAYRLLKSGGDIVYDPDALSTQFYDEDLGSLARKIIESGKTAVLLVKLHPETFEELQFREYNLSGWKWRSLRLFLIWISILIPFTTDALIYAVNLFEKFRPDIHEKLYYLAMDYFFWLGVWSAVRRDKSSKQLISRIKSYKKEQICPTP
jgi:GT2 family glycosyltransferase